MIFWTQDAILKSQSLQNEGVSSTDTYCGNTEKFIIWDGYHHSKKASDYLANKLKKCINHA